MGLSDSGGALHSEAGSVCVSHRSPTRHCAEASRRHRLRQQEPEAVAAVQRGARDSEGSAGTFVRPWLVHRAVAGAPRQHGTRSVGEPQGPQTQVLYYPYGNPYDRPTKWASHLTQSGDYASEGLDSRAAVV